MPWIQLRLNANEETAEKYSDWLVATGSQAVTFIDAQDTPIYEPLTGDEVIYWHNTVVMGLFDANHNMDKVISYLQSIHPDKENMQYKLEQLEDKDWEREWMDNFHPIQFGEKLWICPSWRDIPDPDAVASMRQARLKGDPRAPSLKEHHKRETPTEEELGNHERYLEYELRQKKRTYRAYVEASKIKTAHVLVIKYTACTPSITQTHGNTLTTMDFF